MNIRRRIFDAGLKASLQESAQKRLHHLEQNSSRLQEKSMQTFTLINGIKFECEQLMSDIKQLNDWLKMSDQQLSKHLVMNLSTADEKNEAAKKMLVSGIGTRFWDLIGWFV